MNQITHKTKGELAQECTAIYYKEIERFFAKGVLILVGKDLDILDVALVVQNDDSEQLKQWLESGKVLPVNDEYAVKWSQSETQLLAVTVVPWLLVQEII